MSATMNTPQISTKQIFTDSSLRENGDDNDEIKFSATFVELHGHPPPPPQLVRSQISFLQLINIIHLLPLVAYMNLILFG